MTTRKPAMYSFYEKAIKKAYKKNNFEEAAALVEDAPKNVLQALIKNDIVQGSVEQTRAWEDELADHRQEFLDVDEQLKWEDEQIEDVDYE